MKTKDVGPLVLAFMQYHNLKYDGDVAVCHEAAAAMHLGLYAMPRDVDSVLLEVPLSIFERYKTESNLRQSQFGEYIVINEQLSLRRAGWGSWYLFGWKSLSYSPGTYSSQSPEALLEWLVIKLETGDYSDDELGRLLSDLEWFKNHVMPGWGNDREWCTDLVNRANVLKEKHA